MSDNDTTTEYFEDDVSGDMSPDDAENNPQFAQKIKKLQSALHECDAEKKKYMEDLHRAKADFLNSKRRIEEQAVKDKERATDGVLEELLTVIDSFESAMADTATWEAINPTWRKGIEAIQSKLLSILRDRAIETINPIGLTFDPNEHEAVSNIPVEDEKEIDKVQTVLQKGFRRQGSILRPARVTVGTKAE